MKLSKYLATIFESELEKVFQEEENKPEYLNQNAFKSCRQRARAGLTEPIEKIEDILTVAIAKSRKEKYGEAHEVSTRTLSKEEEDFLSVATWWTTP